MTSPTNAVQQSKALRLVHASMAAGLLIMATVGQFVLRPKMAATDQHDFPPAFRLVILFGILGACVGAILWFRSRVPKRAADQPVDAFWVTASGPAIVGWAIAEGACLLGVIVYSILGFTDALALAGLAFIILLMMNPGRLESRGP